MRSEAEKAYAYWLAGIPGLGDKSIERLLKICGTPMEVYRRSQDKWEGVLLPAQANALKEAGKSREIERDYEKLCRQDISFYTTMDEEYPQRLRQILDPPFGIFVKGRLPQEERLSVAVIGARDCSEYGSFVARGLGRSLAEAGISVVSGMAKGIDGIGQRAALLAGGYSCGVLGCGVDICYPAHNRELYTRLVAEGGVLSCYRPGTKPQPGLFPPRNRIVSALSDAVVVVEARQRSGTLITVDMALEQGKEVYVVPGRLTDRLSDGCNKLIRQGAGIVLSPEDLVEELFASCGMGRGPERKKGRREEVQEGEGGRGEPGETGRLLEALDFYPKSVEQLKESLSGEVTYQETAGLLLKLCLQGKAMQTSAGYYVKKGDVL